MKKFLMPLAAVILFLSTGFAAQLNTAQIKNAQDSFDNGNYAKAIEIYETIINIEKVNNPFVYYNLSNAYYRNADIGKAFLFVEKALRLEPRDKNIRSNKKFLKTLLEQEQGQSLSQESFLTQYFSLNEITVFASFFIIVFILAATGFVLNVVKKKIIFKKAMLICAVCAFISIALTFLKARYEFNNNAVILNAVSLKSSPADNNSELMSIPEGKFVKLLSESENFSLIRVSGTKEKIEGWVPNRFIGKL